MPQTAWSASTILRDLRAGVVVFLVALPLCLGIALASGAELFTGLLAGIIGGVVVGLISGSHTSVSGPAAGLTAVVADQITHLGSFQTFLLALAIGGVIQIVAGALRAGFLAAFFPTSVIRGLLAAIGIILILKQIPHLVGHDADPEGDMAFRQPDHENTFSELAEMVTDLHPGAALIGLLSLAILIFWDQFKSLKKSPIPAPLVVVVLGVAMATLLRSVGGPWEIGASHLVQVPIAGSLMGITNFLQAPDFAQWSNPEVYVAAVTIALVASLETLLNLEAVDRIDPQRRQSPASRELVAQGVGNLTAGLIGGIPVTSVIVRSSVNIGAGAESKLSAVFHGFLLLGSIVLIPTWLNAIPLSCLAAILLVTGIKLASPKLFRQMWDEGRYQFWPFLITVVAIVMTDLLIGIMIGLVVTLSFILHSNFRRPLRQIREKHVGGEVLRIELANQVSFLNKAKLESVLNEIPAGGHVLIDARNTFYIDPDVLGLIREFSSTTGPMRQVQVSLRGFRQRYQLDDQILFVDYTSREVQEQLNAATVLNILMEGNRRFRSGQSLSRDLNRQQDATAAGQHPMAVILGCIDSRTPSEMVFDLGIGDIFSVRMAGNVISPKVLGSIEYSCVVVKAKLILVMGHSKCGAITAAAQLAAQTSSVASATGCQHLEAVISEIQESLTDRNPEQIAAALRDHPDRFVDELARRNVLRTVREIVEQSRSIHDLVQSGQVAVVGGMYDVATGQIDLMLEHAIGLSQDDVRLPTQSEPVTQA